MEISQLYMLAAVVKTSYEQCRALLVDGDQLSDDIFLWNNRKAYRKQIRWKRRLYNKQQYNLFKSFNKKLRQPRRSDTRENQFDNSLMSRYNIIYENFIGMFFICVWPYNFLALKS